MSLHLLIWLQFQIISKHLLIFNTNERALIVCLLCHWYATLETYLFTSIYCIKAGKIKL